MRDALYASKIVSYAQGMELLGAASKEFNWNLNFGDIATIWRGGCIIRAKFLNRIVEAYERDPALHNLLLDSYFTDIIQKTQHNWRIAVATAIEQGVAVPAFSASLAYFDSYRQARLPSNLLQAQRDFFGAHTYERVDKPGVFHTEWLEPEKHSAEKPAAAEGAARRTLRRIDRYANLRLRNHRYQKPLRRFEVKQSMRDEPLRVDPETGESVRRVISGGYGVHVPGGSTGPSVGSVGGSCGPGCGCH